MKSLAYTIDSIDNYIKSKLNIYSITLIKIILEDKYQTNFNHLLKSAIYLAVLSYYLPAELDER